MKFCRYYNLALLLGKAQLCFPYVCLKKEKNIYIFLQFFNTRYRKKEEKVIKTFQKMNLFCANHPLLVQNTFHYLYLASPDHMSHKHCEN